MRTSETIGGYDLQLFLLRCIYCLDLVFLKGGTPMRETNDPRTDLEDLIFDEDAGQPSQR